MLVTCVCQSQPPLNQSPQEAIVSLPNSVCHGIFKRLLQQLFQQLHEQRLPGSTLTVFQFCESRAADAAKVFPVDIHAVWPGLTLRRRVLRAATLGAGSAGKHSSLKHSVKLYCATGKEPQGFLDSSQSCVLWFARRNSLPESSPPLKCASRRCPQTRLQSQPASTRPVREKSGPHDVYAATLTSSMKFTLNWLSCQKTIGVNKFEKAKAKVKKTCRRN